MVDRSWIVAKRSLRQIRIGWFATRSGIVTAARDGYFFPALIH
jgi:hypothetical protein